MSHAVRDPRFGRWIVLGCALLVASPSWAEATSRRLAVLVGANAAVAGRTPLRYAHSDTERMREVLVSAGAFKPSDVTVLLDPQPGEVLAALDKKLAIARSESNNTLLLFYYSGHADSGALFPRGEPLDLEAVRRRLESGAATVRVGIVDSCRGGEWTRAKGLREERPFAVPAPLQVSSEGTVLIASSSGDENAHEADAFKASFFTHHLVAGMRGPINRTTAR